MAHLRHEKQKSKQLSNALVLKVNTTTEELENDVKLINRSITDMYKFEKKELIKKRTFKKTLGSVGTIG